MLRECVALPWFCPRGGRPVLIQRTVNLFLHYAEALEIHIILQFSFTRHADDMYTATPKMNGMKYLKLSKGVITDCELSFHSKKTKNSWLCSQQEKEIQDCEVQL